MAHSRGEKVSSANLPDPEGESRPLPQGQLTSDADEVERRRRRGREEGLAIESPEAGLPLFGAFAVRSGSGVAYRVEIRSLHRRLRHVMLRRCKDEVRGELPEHTANQ
jgi:hypothetical protein